MIIVVLKKDARTVKKTGQIFSHRKRYKICKEGFNKKVESELCNKELNKSYLRSQNKKQHIQHNNQQQYNQQYHNQQHYNQYIEKQHYNQQLKIDGASEKNSGASENDRTLIVGPSFCGKSPCYYTIYNYFI